MLDFLAKVLESTFGVPIFGVAALILVFVVYRMARHEVLLFGHFEGISNKRSRYSFYIQNLEHVSFPGPFCISVIDKRPERHPDKELSVRVYAGPKHVVKVQSSNSGDTTDSVRRWSARFEDLPPLDTWLIVCDDESTWLDLSFDAGEENKKITPKLMIDVSRRHLSLRTDRPEESYEGLTHTPSLGVFLGTLAASVLGYLGAIPLLNLSLFQNALRVNRFTFGGMDLIVVALITVLVFIGFKSIRRSVYPIIQGYFEQTVVIGPTGNALEKDEPEKRSTIRKWFGSMIRKGR
jgi:hypothetical protein